MGLFTAKYPEQAGWLEIFSQVQRNAPENRPWKRKRIYVRGTKLLHDQVSIDTSNGIKVNTLVQTMRAIADIRGTDEIKIDPSKYKSSQEFQFACLQKLWTLDYYW